MGSPLGLKSKILATVCMVLLIKLIRERSVKRALITIDLQQFDESLNKIFFGVDAALTQNDTL